MLLPEPTSAGRLRFFLQKHKLTQAQLARILGVTGARISQLINGPGLKTPQITALSTKFPGFSAAYYLDGWHPIMGMVELDSDIFKDMAPTHELIYEAMKVYQGNGWPTSTYIPAGGEQFKVMLLERERVFVGRGFVATLQAAQRTPAVRVSSVPFL